ncbi:hypothetical protein K440DRAFT_194095 [Wilcoxina mikolae CBS 423.85]|nr:hypothetical protein K440DRAFT_194095 [Wilcoxina mikolae CBS 423.85]
MQMRICHSLIVAVVSLGGLASAAPSNYFSGTAIGRPCDPVPCAPPCPPPCATPCPAPCGCCPKPCGCADVVETTVITTPPCAPVPCAPKPCGCGPAPCGCPAPCPPPIKVVEAAPVEVVEAAPVEVVEAAPAVEVVEPAAVEVVETEVVEEPVEVVEEVAPAPCKRQCGCPCKCNVVEPTITQVNPAIVNTSTDVQPVDIIQPVQDVVQPVVDEHVKPVYSETVNAPQIQYTVDPCTCGGCAPAVPVAC